MSKYQDCAVFVDANGRYCCNPKTLTIGEGCSCGYTISLANVPAVDLQILVGDEWVVYSTLTDVTTNIIAAGTYRIDPAFCEGLEGFEAPEEGAMAICCEELDCAALDYIAICEKLESLSVMLEGDAMVTVDFAPVVDKLCEVLDATVEGNTSATELLEKVCATLDATVEGNATAETSLEKLCEIADTLALSLTADAVAHAAELACLETLKATAADQLTCLETIKANTAAAEADAAAQLECLQQIKANTAAITGIETSLGQVGCIVDADGTQTGTVLVCKVTDTSTVPPTDTIKVWAFNTDGTVVEDYTGPYEPCTNLSALLECLELLKAKTFSVPRIWGVRIDTNWVDNQSDGEDFKSLMYSQDEHDLEITMSDGSVCTVNLPALAPGDYNGQFAALIPLLNDCTGKDWGTASAPRDGNTATPLARYAVAECCPGDDFIVAVKATTIGGKRDGRLLQLLVGYDKGEVTKYKEYDCGPGTAPIWTDMAGAIVPAPDLTCAALDCDFPVEGPCVCPETLDCESKTYGPLLDCIFDADPDADPQTVGTDIFVTVEVCDGVTTSLTYTLDADGFPVEYEVQGELATPEKEVLVAEPPCPDVDWTAIQIKRKLNILDNSLWDNAPTLHIGAGNSPTMEIDVTFENGVQRFSWGGGTGFFPAFNRWLSTAAPDCVPALVCANWDRCPYGMPWGLEVPRECLWARGFSLYCCEGTPCIVMAEVVESSDADWVGASKQACTFDGPVETIYEAHVGCNRIHKDCEGNLIDLPANCCPYVPQDCDAFCPPRVAYDLVCAEAEQVVNDVTIVAFNPIIRQQVTEQVQVDCECVDAGPTVSRFFNFLDPAQEFTGEVVFDGPCDPQTTVTKERCDAKGRVITVVEISTTTSGSAVATTFYDENGQVVTPEFPLSVCNPRMQIICGCVRDVNGNIVVRNVQQHNAFDELGTAAQTYFTQGKALTLGRGWYFDCDCEDRKEDTTGSTKHTYNLNEFSFPCETSTIEVDGVEVDLCGGDSGPTVIPSSGDICTVGGVRSDHDGDRCYTDPQADPAGFANELLMHGSIGDTTVNPLAQQPTSNFGMAVLGTFPSLVGTTAPTIDFGATWNTGSGIAIAAYDCATGNDLSVVGGTPSTYDAVGGPGCQVPSSRGPTDAWSFNGAHTVTFDTSAVADLATVVFYSIVLNPGGPNAGNPDWLSGVTVQGLPPGGVPCDIQSFTDLEAALTSLLPDCEVEYIPEVDLCITCDGVTLGPLTCDDATADPTLTNTGVVINPAYVALAPCSVDALAGDDSAMISLLTEIADLQGDNLVKNCLINDALSNPNCPAPLTQTLDKAALELNLKGDVVSQYPVGTSISLQDGNGNICGSATVDDVATPAVYDATADVTTIQIEECELQDGKTPVQVTEAKPVLQSSVKALRSLVQQVNIRKLETVTKKVATKEEKR